MQSIGIRSATAFCFSKSRCDLGGLLYWGRAYRTWSLLHLNHVINSAFGRVESKWVCIKESLNSMIDLLPSSAVVLSL